MIDLIRQKIVDSLASPVPAFTRRDVRLPAIRGKAVTVIGMRRTGKSTFLWQVLSDRLSQAGKPSPVAGSLGNSHRHQPVQRIRPVEHGLCSDEGD